MDPRKRVSAFLTDYVRSHAKMVSEHGDDVDFGRWGELVAELHLGLPTSPHPPRSHNR